MSPEQFASAHGTEARWQTRQARAISAVSLLLLGWAGTRAALTQSQAVVIAYVVFALTVISLTVRRSPDIRVSIQRFTALGVYLIVVGFGVLTRGHNYLTGALGVLLLLIPALVVLAATRAQRPTGPENASPTS